MIYGNKHVRRKSATVQSSKSKAMAFFFVFNINMLLQLVEIVNKITISSIFIIDICLINKYY